MKNTTKTPSQIILAILALLAFSLPSPAWGQTYTLAPSPHLVALNNSGTIINSGCIWTYLTGTSTAADTYTTSNGTLNANPIIADSAGRFVAFLQPGISYRFVYENTPCSASSHGTVLATRDGIAAVPVSGLNVDVTGTAGEALSLGDLVYLSDGSASLDAGEWYRADADNTYSSIAATSVGFATAAAAANGTVTVRIAGRMTGLSLTAGSIYFASATAAALTTAPPLYGKCVGKADTTTTLVLPCDSPSFNAFRPPQGRCTLTSATPVTTADVTAATTLYYALYGGNQITLYDGTARWVQMAFSQLSLTVPATTSTMYDVFVDYTAGVPALEAVAWTNDTTRATALALQNGVYVQTSDTDSLYVCSFRTTGVSGQTEDSLAKRYVWNYYNRVQRALRRITASGSWTYNTTTIRQAEGSTSNQVEVVVGVAESTISLHLQVGSRNATADILRAAGFGEDSTTTFSAEQTMTSAVAAPVPVNQTFAHVARLSKSPAIGRHYYSWNEIATAAASATTFDGTGNLTGANAISSGIEGEIDN